MSSPKAQTRPRQPLAAFQIHIARNVAVQGLGLAMVVAVGAGVLPWPLVLSWAITVGGVVALEHRVLVRLASPGLTSPVMAGAAAAIRVFATSLYALAAMALLARGGRGEQFFALAMMSASVVNVLMRYYRSPGLLAASLTPYLVVFALVAGGLSRTAAGDVDLRGAAVGLLTLAMLAVQIWSARAQLVGGWRELNAAREAAELRERAADSANRAKSDFLTHMSHELRTPLNGALGAAQILARDELTPSQREQVRLIRRSSENLLSVLDDLLDLSKLEAGAFDLELGDFDMEHLVRGVVSAYRPLSERKGLAFAFTLAPEALGLYRGDSARIRRILYSLVDNAVKFTQAGSVGLEVASAGDWTEFRVADTGLGLAQADRTRLFESFYQADAGLTRRHGGLGVGLKICHDLAELMGGKIAVDSLPTRGSVFTLRLPLPRATAPRAVAPRPAPSPTPTLRVLAAEDNPTNQWVLKALLETAGIEPVLVASGREAVEAWEDQAWDIILMDIQMPEMTGVEATQAIRSREAREGRAKTPIVAVTANAMSHQIAKYLACGMDGVVPKPIDLEHLLQTLERVLDPPVQEAGPRSSGVAEAPARKRSPV